MAAVSAPPWTFLRRHCAQVGEVVGKPRVLIAGLGDIGVLTAIHVQDDGLLYFAPDGRTIQIPAWVINRLLLPWVVRRGYYRGVRRA